MPESNLDKGQGFSGIGTTANPVRPRTLRPGGTEDIGEAVDLKPIDQSRPRGLNENEMPGPLSGYKPRGALSKGDAPYTLPADSKGSDKPIAMYSDDSRDVGTSSGQYFGSNGERGDEEMDWRTREVAGDSEGPAYEETVGKMPGLRNTDGTVKTIRRWQDVMDWSKGS